MDRRLAQQVAVISSLLCLGVLLCLAISISISHLPATYDNRNACADYAGFYQKALSAPVESIASAETAYWKTKYIEAGCMR